MKTSRTRFTSKTARYQPPTPCILCWLQAAELPPYSGQSKANAAFLRKRQHLEVTNMICKLERQSSIRWLTSAIGILAMALSPGNACFAERPSETDYLYPKDGGMYVGADYYPEHWPEERWETDLKMMKDAGFNIVRVGEFSWVL